MENQNAQNLAERIAILLQENVSRSDDSPLSNLAIINQRLDKLESNITAQNLKSQISNLKSTHFAQEKFTSLEELAVESANGLKDEKACPFEPAGKPCDHCAMCNSHGF